MPGDRRRGSECGQVAAVTESEGGVRDGEPHLRDAHPHLPADGASAFQHLASALEEAGSTAQEARGHQLQHLIQSGPLYILTHDWGEGHLDHEKGK